MAGPHLFRRLVVGFYCIGSLDLLGLLNERTSSADREVWRSWIWDQYTSTISYGCAFPLSSWIVNEQLEVMALALDRAHM